MNYKIAIYGISGSGKTTLIKAITKEIYNAEFFEGSNIISNMIDIEKFKKLSQQQKYKIRKKVIKYIEKNAKKKYIFVDGHYSFLNKDNFEIAITEADIDFYTHIFYLDIPINIIKEQQIKDKIKKRDFSIKQLEKWKEFEKSKLKKLCVDNNINFYTLTNHNLAVNINLIHEILNQNNLFNDLKQFVKNNTKNKYILLDADMTIVNFDSGKDYIYKILDIKIQDVKFCFKEEGYCFSSFAKLSKLHSQIDNNNFIKAMKDIASIIDIEQDFLHLMKKYNQEYNICIVTAGFRILWQEILKKYNLENIKVFGGNNLNIDNYIIDNNLKGLIANYLQSNNKYVVSFGDSLVDKNMLINSNKSFFVIRNKIRQDVIDILKHYEHIKYLSINSLEINELDKVNFNMINKELANANIQF